MKIHPFKRMPLLFWLFFLGMVCHGQLLNAQKIYQAKITDAKEQPLSDVLVHLVGSNKIYTSNENGEVNFSAKPEQKIEITRVGYLRQEYTLTNIDTLSFSLKYIEGGDEVVVTATGIRKEAKKLGYATQTIDADQFTKSRQPNALNSLKGNVAGLIVNVTPEIGHAPNISIRGDGAPMYVVDGVPMTSDTYNINPDDIDTYTILKGPNATALYGFAGQNGAIIITTKKAKKKGLVVDFNNSTMWSKGFLAIPKVQNEYGPGEYGTYAFGDGKGGGVNDYDYDGGWGPKLDGRLLPQWDGTYYGDSTFTTYFDNGQTYTGHIKPTPWTAKGPNNLNNFIQTGLLQSNSIAISSSSEKTDVRFSFGNTYQKGIVPNTSLNNFNLTGNVTNRFTDKLTLNTYINYNRQSTPNLPDVNYGPNSLIYNLVLWSGADWNVKDMRDYWQPGKEGVQQKFVEYYRYNNPYFMSYEWLRSHYMNNIYGYTALNYKVNNDLQVMFRPSVNTYDFLNTEKVPYSASDYRDYKYGDYREDHRHLFQTNVELRAVYNKNHIMNFLDLNAIVGANARSFRFNSDYTTTNYLNIPGVYAFSNSMNPVQATSFNSQMKVLSAYYSVDLGYKSYITLNVTGRADKSSSLPTNTNTYFYPSFNLATVVSDYVKLPEFISFAKLRASYAESKSGGTQSTFTPNITNLPGSEYGYSYPSPYDGPQYQFGQYYSLTPTYNNVSSAYYSDQLIDPSISTSERKATEFGADIRFLHNRIGIDITRYHYHNTAIINRTISQATGYTSLLTNGNVYNNDGWEVTLNASPIKNPSGFSWNVAVNWSTYKRVWVDNSSPDNWSYNGKRVDLVYGDAFVRTSSGQLVHDASSGLLLRYSDLGVNAKKVYGHSDPNWIWGVVNNLSYKNISLSFQFDGMVGGVMEDYVRKKSLQGGRQIETDQGAFAVARPDDGKVNGTYAGSYVGSGVVFSGQDIQLDPINGTITNEKNLTATTNTTATSVQAYVTRMASIPDLDIIKKTFAKLRTVTLTYNIPQDIVNHQKWFSAASVSLVGNNLLYFFPNKYKDIDVDQYTQDSGSGLQTPSVRNFGFNVHLSF
ncbi:SusC/RagA family TonB-linked outer membrane protein [Rhizosphaericola mali]|uniref:SusC/RagA family TonB-linked outer membrane protein n=1 Tax=Rhizosphaericola mali TaxID=2545455 RepID=A0A5P2G554_9BACT|nr:SusC/RagA family TonB-linked outer membrane protein [Rhizosphaericola mali]QES89818.1 SusC/RagA family TonB-linked outer membrane protein [Rhizosphaericola mali]